MKSSIEGTTGLYNGNITEQLYRSSLDNKKRGYSYVYDRLNRLTLAALIDPDLTISSNDTPYGEKLTYDKNGNILKLTRNGAPVANKVTQIDNLTYSYEAGSNKLSKIVDASGNLEGFKKGNTTTSADYTYDVFGNLMVDRNKNITKISYNSLHLPVELNIGSNKIAYLYDASGKKVQKKVIQGTSSSTTDYLNGFQYVDNVLSFIPTSEGFFDFKTNKYVYQYVDQLGNVRLSYSNKDGNNKIETAEIIEQINYYPFGLAHKGYNQKNDPLMKDFKYQYNGKENQEELGLNVYDYGARNYDAAIGRWMNVDPLAEKYYNISSYVYVANNPINAIDPDGRDIVFLVNKTRYKFDGTNLISGNGKMVNPKSYQSTSVGRIVNAYKNISKMDEHYKGQIQELINSKNEHLIDTDKKSNSGGEVRGGNEFDTNKATKEKVMQGISVGSTTAFNFNEGLKEDFLESQGVPKTDETTVAHELQHQYDFETGNMADSYGKKGDNNNQAEMRAVRNEDIVRKELKIGKRLDYEGK